jgi:hypothetical protein
VGFGTWRSLRQAPFFRTDAVCFSPGDSQPQKFSQNRSLLHEKSFYWVKLDSASKTEPTQNSGELLRKALVDCSVVASATRLDLDTLFGSESAYAAFQKCIYDKGYTKS